MYDAVIIDDSDCKEDKTPSVITAIVDRKNNVQYIKEGTLSNVAHSWIDVQGEQHDTEMHIGCFMR